VQWKLRSIMQLALQFIAVEFLVGEILEKLLKAQGESIAERLHYTVSEGIVTVAVVLVLWFISGAAENRINQLFLARYKRLLQKLVADRVSTYWVTYNTLLRIFAGCEAEIEKLKSSLRRPDGEMHSAPGEEAT
jgi:hypothetical protein